MRFDKLCEIQEIRLRAGRNASVVVDGRECNLISENRAIVVLQDDLNRVVANACRQSVYSAADAISQGYLPLPGGHRLGLCGTVADTGASVTIRDYSSVNIRIAKAYPGCADEIVKNLEDRPAGVLLIGSPGSGKTTMIRDLVRQLSDRFGHRIGLADERGEIASVSGGIPQLNVGIHTDVMTGGRKSESLMCLLRSMSPEYLAMDEISAASDLESLQRAAYCGVRLIASAHAFDQSELYRRPGLKQLMQAHLFDFLVVLKPDRSVTIERML